MVEALLLLLLGRPYSVWFLFLGPRDFFLRYNYTTIYVNVIIEVHGAHHLSLFSSIQYCFFHHLNAPSWITSLFYLAWQLLFFITAFYTLNISIISHIWAIINLLPLFHLNITITSLTLEATNHLVLYINESCFFIFIKFYYLVFYDDIENC